MKHTIGIEPDEPPSQAGRVKVVIRRKNGEVVGVPLRDVSEETAREMLGPLRYAFGFGVDASRWIVARACDHIDLQPSPDVATGIVKSRPSKAKL